MTPVAVAVVAVGTGAGASLRYATDRLVSPRIAHRYPWATFIVNIVGSLILGVVAGAVVHHDLSSTWRLLLGTGLCGGLTTFSTFSYESMRLWQSQDKGLAVTYVFASVVAGLAAAAVGLALTS